jgi:SAM-dependent methyltransferase
MKKTPNKKIQSDNWNHFYENGSIPWKSLGLSGPVRKYLREYASGKDVLEVGCGTGEDAQEFIRAGFSYCGMDVSSHAIRLARTSNPKGKFFTSDFFNARPKKRFAVVYDKGVFHNLRGPRQRSAFARKVALSLSPGGIWVSVSGSADNFDPRVPHGAVFLQNLVEPVERYFEVLEVKKAPYGVKGKEFLAWHCVFRRR